jgi:hypothetical protein
MILLAQIEQEMLEGKLEFFRLNSDFIPYQQLDLQTDHEEVVQQQKRSGFLSQKPIHPRSSSEMP